MKGLLLAGGHGTRLRPLTFSGNKHMIPIANKPMLSYGLEQLVRAGIREIGIILGPIHEGVREFIGDGNEFGAKITYIEQNEPKGLAHAVLISEEFLRGEPFVMYLGDNLLKQGVKPIIYTYVNNNSDCVICVTPVPNPSQYGVVEVDDNNRIIKLVEKPREPRSNLALVGAYLFNESIFEAVKRIKLSWRNELEITDAIQYLLDTGRKIAVNHVHGWWKDTGKPEDLLEANHLVLDDLMPKIEGIIESNVNIRGRVSIGKNSAIRSNTTIKGPTIIGENCEIGPNAYIGPYTAVGDNSKISNGEIEGSIIMNNVVISCNKKIVDSIIGRGAHLESADFIRPYGMKFILGDSTYCRV